MLIYKTRHCTGKIENKSNDRFIQGVEKEKGKQEIVSKWNGRSYVRYMYIEYRKNIRTSRPGCWRHRKKERGMILIKRCHFMAETSLLFIFPI